MQQSFSQSNSTKLYLSKPGILTSLGDGLDTNIQQLLAGAKSPLCLSDKLFQASGLTPKLNMLGEVNMPLREFPADLPEKHHSRNNQLLWHSLRHIEPQIQQAIARFGVDRVAVIIGTSTTGVEENLPVFQYASKHEDWSGARFKQQQQYFSAPADFIAYQYGLKNVIYGVSTACTSGSKALITAGRLIKAQLCDAVICGGVDTLSLLTLVGFNSLSILSSKLTNPFSANRQGINIGEGSTVFIMSREVLGDIENEAIELLGYGSSCDAYHISSPHPEGEGAISAFQQALHSAKIAPSQIGWINLHGTGTINNDHMEALSVQKIFGSHTPCTSTKPYTGHALAAAGAIEAGILWGVISRKLNPEGKLPPQLWDKVKDESLAPISITDQYSHWQAGRRIGASSSFAFGGNNSILILGESGEKHA